MTAEFFVPGTTYLRDVPFRAPEICPEFQCVAVAVHPSKGEDRAFGFWRQGAFSPWVSQALSLADWERGWLPIPRPVLEPFDYDDGMTDLTTPTT